jgi:hypothetical protein
MVQLLLSVSLAAVAALAAPVASASGEACPLSYGVGDTHHYSYTGAAHVMQEISSDAEASEPSLSEFHFTRDIDFTVTLLGLSNETGLRHFRLDVQQVRVGGSLADQIAHESHLPAHYRPEQLHRAATRAMAENPVYFQQECSGRVSSVVASTRDSASILGDKKSLIRHFSAEMRTDGQDHVTDEDHPHGKRSVNYAYVNNAVHMSHDTHHDYYQAPKDAHIFKRSDAFWTNWQARTKESHLVDRAPEGHVSAVHRKTHFTFPPDRQPKWRAAVPPSETGDANVNGQAFFMEAKGESSVKHVRHIKRSEKLAGGLQKRDGTGMTPAELIELNGLTEAQMNGAFARHLSTDGETFVSSNPLDLDNHGFGEKAHMFPGAESLEATLEALKDPDSPSWMARQLWVYLRTDRTRVTALMACARVIAAGSDEPKHLRYDVMRILGQSGRAGEQELIRQVIDDEEGHTTEDRGHALIALRFVEKPEQATIEMVEMFMSPHEENLVIRKQATLVYGMMAENVAVYDAAAGREMRMHLMERWIMSVHDGPDEYYTLSSALDNAYDLEAHPKHVLIDRLNMTVSIVQRQQAAASQHRGFQFRMPLAKMQALLPVDFHQRKRFSTTGEVPASTSWRQVSDEAYHPDNTFVVTPTGVWIERTVDDNFPVKRYVDSDTQRHDPNVPPSDTADLVASASVAAVKPGEDYQPAGDDQYVCDEDNRRIVNGTWDRKTYCDPENCDPLPIGPNEANELTCQTSHQPYKERGCTPATNGYNPCTCNAVDDKGCWVPGVCTTESICSGQNGLFRQWTEQNAHPTSGNVDGGCAALPDAVRCCIARSGQAGIVAPASRKRQATIPDGLDGRDATLPESRAADNEAPPCEGRRTVENCYDSRNRTCGLDCVNDSGEQCQPSACRTCVDCKTPSGERCGELCQNANGGSCGSPWAFFKDAFAAFFGENLCANVTELWAPCPAAAGQSYLEMRPDEPAQLWEHMIGGEPLVGKLEAVMDAASTRAATQLCGPNQDPWSKGLYGSGGQGVVAQCRKADSVAYKLFVGGFAGLEAYQEGRPQGYNPVSSRFELLAAYLQVKTEIPDSWNMLDGPETCASPVNFTLFARAGGKVYFFHNTHEVVGNANQAFSCYLADQTCSPSKPPRHTWHTDQRDILNKYLPDLLPNVDVSGIPINIQLNVKASTLWHHAIAFAFNEFEGGLMLTSFLQPTGRAEASFSATVSWDGRFGDTEEANEVEDQRQSVEIGLRAVLEIFNMALPGMVSANWETSRGCLNVSLEVSALGGRVDLVLKIGGVSISDLFGSHLTLWEWEPLLSWRAPFIETACCKRCPGSCQNATVSGDPSMLGGLNGAHSRCDFNVGECVCRGGWDGEECMIPCPEDCSRAELGVWCNDRTPFQDPMIRGRCKCEAGSWGYDCSLACPGGRNNPCHKRTDHEVCFDPNQFALEQDVEAGYERPPCGAGGPGTAGCLCRNSGAECNAGLVCTQQDRVCAIPSENGPDLEYCNNTCTTAGVCECWRFPPRGPYFGKSCDVTCFPDKEIPVLADGSYDPEWSRCPERSECKYYPNTEHAECKCYRNYYGENCDSTCPVTEDGRDLPCSLRGECTEIRGAAHCLCDLGFQGDVCERLDFQGSGLALTFPGSVQHPGVAYPLTADQLNTEPAEGILMTAWVQVHEIPSATVPLVAWAWGTIALNKDGQFGLCDAENECTFAPAPVATVNAENANDSPWYFVAVTHETDVNSGVGLRRVYAWERDAGVNTAVRVEENKGVARLTSTDVNVGAFPFKGKIDHMHIVNRLASDEDLRVLSTGTPAWSTPGLIFQALCDTGRGDHEYAEFPFIPAPKPVEVYWSDSGAPLTWASISSKVEPLFTISRPDMPEFTGYDISFGGKRATKAFISLKPISPPSADGNLLTCKVSAFLVDPAHDLDDNMDDVGNLIDLESIPKIAIFTGKSLSGSDLSLYSSDYEIPTTALKWLRDGTNMVYWQMDGGQGACNDPNSDFAIANSFITVETAPIDGFVQTTGLSEGYMDMTPNFGMSGNWGIEFWVFIEPVRMRASALQKSSMLLHYPRGKVLDVAADGQPNLGFFQIGGSEDYRGMSVRYASGGAARIYGYDFGYDRDRGRWFHVMVEQKHSASSCSLVLYQDGETKPEYKSPTVSCGDGSILNWQSSSNSLRIGASFEGRFNDLIFWQGQVPVPRETMILSRALNPLFNTASMKAAFLFDNQDVVDTVAGEADLLLPESTGKASMSVALVRGVFRGLIFGPQHRWKACPGVDEVLAPESVCSNNAFQEKGVCVLEDEEHESEIVQKAKCDCHTDQGFIGVACQLTCAGSIQNDDGTLTACNGHGTCTADESETAVLCICDEGFTGPGCSLTCPGFVYPNGPPGQQVCNGHGTCEFNETSTSAYCLCSANSGFYGLECEYEQNELPIRGCDNCDGLNEICADGICDCEHPYYRVGAHCQPAADAATLAASWLALTFLAIGVGQRVA